MLKAVILLLVGFVLLIKGADFFVDGSSAVAKILKVPTLIIGLTIVAMGTSLPELSVSITASMAGSNALAVSNVIGSNIFNMIVVLGASALMTPLSDISGWSLVAVTDSSSWHFLSVSLYIRSFPHKKHAKQLWKQEIRKVTIK